MFILFQVRIFKNGFIFIAYFNGFILLLNYNNPGMQYEYCAQYVNFLHI